MNASKKNSEASSMENIMSLVMDSVRDDMNEIFEAYLEAHSVSAFEKLSKAEFEKMVEATAQAIISKNDIILRASSDLKGGVILLLEYRIAAEMLAENQG